MKVYLADGFKVKGGYSYEMEIASVGGAAPSVAEPLNGENEPAAEDVARAEGAEAPAPVAEEPAAPAKPAKKKGRK